MKVAAFIIGGAIGAAAWGVMGFLLGALVGVLLAHYFTPESPASLIAQGKLAALEKRVAALESALKIDPERTVAVPDPERTVAMPEPAAQPPAMPTPPVAPVATPPSPQPFASAAAPAPSEETATLEPSKLWAWLTGGNAMVRVGVVVLFFGVAFLMKYAAEHVHVPIEARLTGVALGAIAMLAFGWHLRTRAGAYGLVLQGGGVGVLYLVVFGAFRIWSLLPAELAFGLLVAIALGSAALAVLQDSRALAIAGATGGFLAPVLASTGQGSHVALFSFYLVLNLGIFAVAWHKAWRELNIVGFAFTLVIGGWWGEAYYRPEHYASTQPFLAAFFLLYVAIAVLYALRRAPRLSDYVDSVLVFGVPLVAAGLQFGMVKEIEYGAAWSALAAGAFYVATAHQLWRQQRETLRLLVECFIALGVAFATLAIPLAFDGRWTAASWALEGAAALWVGVRQNRALPRYFGLLLQPAAGVAFLAESAHLASALPVLNSRFIGGMTVALSGLFCAWYLQRKAEKVRFADVPVAELLLAWGACWWIATGWRELDVGVPNAMVRGSQLLYAAASAVFFAYARRWLDWRSLAYCALALLPVMAGFAVRWMAESSHPFSGLGYLAWPASFVAAYWMLALAERDLAPVWAQAGHCIALWLLALIGGWQCAWQIDELVGEGRIWSQIGLPLVPALLAAVVATRTQADRWPFTLHLPAYLTLALPPVMLALWLWVLYINFASNGNPAPLPYVPLLNPLDVAVALIFVIYLLWRRALAHHPAPSWLADIGTAAPAWLGATAFIWANGVLLRSLHHWAAVPFRLDAMLRSTLVQASFSVFWSLIALGLMVFANRRRIRVLWVCGAALLAVVVVKLFVIDLSRIGGMERIVSFLGVGVLLLVIGYLAPVPPRREEKA